MKAKMICGGLVLVAMAGILTSGQAYADNLQRSSCWHRVDDRGAKRDMCFHANRRVTMKTLATVGNNTTSTTWSTCEYTGDYIESGNYVTVTFRPGSGGCSNGARSPQFTAVCDFSSGDALECRGSAVVDGKVYEYNATLN